MKKPIQVIVCIGLFLLAVPAVQVAHAVVGFGPLGDRSPLDDVDVAASVYAEVTHAACVESFGPTGQGYEAVYVCATEDDARLDYAASKDSVPLPQVKKGSYLTVYAISCGDSSCASRTFYGPVPDGAFEVGILMGSATLRTTVTDDDGEPCALDLTLDTPTGPKLGPYENQNVDPTPLLSISIRSEVNAVAHNLGTASGSACGIELSGSTRANVSRGARLVVEAWASTTPPAG